MENHPIPQDVTGFKFRLIGSITVKQFLYIVGAAAICGLFFIMPIPFLIKWPIIIAVAGIGAAIAFLPIEGRPMDVMLVNFLKALPAENQYLFHKQGASALIHDFFIPQGQKQPTNQQHPTQQQNKRELLLNQLVRKNTSYKPDEDEREQLDNIKGFFTNAETPVTGMQRIDDTPQSNAYSQSAPSTIVRPPQNNLGLSPVRADSYTPTPQAPQQRTNQTQDLPEEEPEQATQSSPQYTHISEKQPYKTSPAAHTKEPEKPKKSVGAAPQPKKEAGPEESSEKVEKPNETPPVPKKQYNPQPIPTNVNAQPGAKNKEETQEPSSPAKSLKPEDQLSSGFPQIPDVPNVVLGIVKDPRGKVLPNIIVEVVDESKNPVRAFKTNALGQFASATPLSEGKYQILLEDPKRVHEFTPIDIEMKNEIFQPIEIISTDQREKLRQELFGGTNQIQQQQ